MTHQLTPASAIAIKVPSQNVHHNSPRCVAAMPNRRSTIRHSLLGIGPNGEVIMPLEKDSDDDEGDAEAIVRVLERGEPPQNCVMSEADGAEEQDMSEDPLSAMSTWRTLTDRREIERHIQFFIQVGVCLAVLRRIRRIDEVTVDGEDGTQVLFFDADRVLILSLRYYALYAPGEE